MNLPTFTAEASLQRTGGYRCMIGALPVEVSGGVIMSTNGLNPCCSTCMGPCLVTNPPSVCIPRCSRQCSTNCAEHCGSCTPSRQCCNYLGSCWTQPC